MWYLGVLLVWTRVEKEVAIADELDCPALLGLDLGKEVFLTLLQCVVDKNTSDKKGFSGNTRVEIGCE